jgi:hypothetical protein
MPRLRGKNLNEEIVDSILGIIDGWAGRLSWDGLLKAIEARMNLTYTRQALYRHQRIRNAFSLRKDNSRGERERQLSANISPELRVALERIARLESENKRLLTENNNLLEQFARWAYNAHVRNLSEEILNRPLFTPDRGQTKK